MTRTVTAATIHVSKLMVDEMSLNTSTIMLTQQGVKEETRAGLFLLFNGEINVGWYQF